MPNYIFPKCFFKRAKKKIGVSFMILLFFKFIFEIKNKGDFMYFNIF